MGALEASDSQAAATIPAASALQTISDGVHIAWQPFPGDVSGYQIYFGRSAATANRFVSNLPTDSGLIDPTAPAVTYDAARDLGLSRGDTACFRIYGYDFARTLTDQSALVCTVV
jgi:hypothetical protein